MTRIVLSRKHGPLCFILAQNFGQYVPYSFDLEGGMSCYTEMNECGRALEMPKATATTCHCASEGVCHHSSKQYPSGQPTTISLAYSTTPSAP